MAADLDAAIRAKLASWGDDPCGCACHRVQPTHTITSVEFATEPYAESRLGEPRHTVPETGRYLVEKRLTQ